MAKNVPAPKAPAKLATKAYIGDPILFSPTTHKAKGCVPSQPKVKNSGVTKA